MAFTIPDDSFGHWLAGFVDGEGSFLIGKTGRGYMHCSFRIALHAEDEPILREIAERTGVGQVWVKQSPSMKSPAAMWSVTSKEGCYALTLLFDEFPLRAKKRRDFEIWKDAVNEWCRLAPKGNQYTPRVPIDYTTMNTLRHQLRAGRPNRGPALEVV